MPEINFQNKTFTLVENSEKGAASSKTIFKYQQEGNLVTADYSGGVIKYGSIVARLEQDQLHMLYHCMTVDQELKAGKAIAKISFTKDKRIKLSLNWEWLGDQKDKGTSEYIELP